ncbi:phosphatase PAP2 family protein [Streptomyces sp. NBRC 110035]|uniref:phosphatase PAP2 family protein n=1 Tax=Streptomyces sp. NBRC 110035 TaxID=1547867 RepID=UPI0005A874B2|nr:phosphatase PAP2 family protein [Streptomyces sp. NBRC 110035]
MLLLGPPVLLFALITWQVVADGPLVDLDERLSRVLVEPDTASEVLSDLGNIEVALPLLAAALVYVAWRGRAVGRDRWWLPPAAGATAMALVPVLVVPLKEWTDRPGTPAVPPAVGYYPSGHTATAVVAYGATALLLLPLLRSRAARRALLLLCAALVAGASYGLVRRGCHWPLDVAAGWCLGAVLLICLWLPAGRSNAQAATGRQSTGRKPAGRPK